MAGERKRIVVIGAGFAGMWSALSARRAIVYNATEKSSPIDVVVIAPSDDLVVRPRLYENGPENMKSSLTDLFAATGVGFIKGAVDKINTEGHEVSVLDPQGVRSSVTYDRLVVAAGSRLVRPRIDGLDEHAFSIDSMDEAVRLDNHLKSVANLPPSSARDTAVVCGGGFTGIEMAAELPARLRATLGPDADVRVVVVDRNEHIGPDLGPGPRPAIIEALKSLGVEMKLGSAVTAVDALGVTLASGERIETLTAAWTGGVAANALTQQIAGEKDRFGRLCTDRTLRVPSESHIYATGDTAHAATDDDGNFAMMSCQHANILGRFSGYNAAADLLGVPQVPYEQANYVTCLDLGPWGAVVTKGWEREIELTGAEAKKVKQWINGVLIYPPKADAEEALAAANPAYKIPDLADGAAAQASF